MSLQCAFSQRKVVSQFQKWNKQLCVLFMPDLQELHRTNEPKAETNPRYSFGRYSADCLSARTGAAGCSRSHDTVIHSAGRYSEVVEFATESITSQSNLVRSIQIRHRIMLKLQTSEQMPLMWKPGETLFNKHITTIHHGFNITTGTTCGRNGLMS